jgi:hypothetical protein
MRILLLCVLMFTAVDPGARAAERVVIDLQPFKVEGVTDPWVRALDDLLVSDLMAATGAKGKFSRCEIAVTTPEARAVSDAEIKRCEANPKLFAEPCATRKGWAKPTHVVRGSVRQGQGGLTWGLTASGAAPAQAQQALTYTTAGPGQFDMDALTAHSKRMAEDVLAKLCPLAMGIDQTIALCFDTGNFQPLLNSFRSELSRLMPTRITATPTAAETPLTPAAADLRTKVLTALRACARYDFKIESTSSILDISTAKLNPSPGESFAVFKKWYDWAAPASLQLMEGDMAYEDPLEAPMFRGTISTATTGNCKCEVNKRGAWTHTCAAETCPSRNGGTEGERWIQIKELSFSDRQLTRLSFNTFAIVEFKHTNCHKGKCSKGLLNTETPLIGCQVVNTTAEPGTPGVSVRYETVGISVEATSEAGVWRGKGTCGPNGNSELRQHTERYSFEIRHVGKR